MGFTLDKSTHLLSTILIILMLSLISSTTFILYEAAFEEKRIHLIQLVQSQARLMEAVARFDQEFSFRDVKGGAQQATLDQIKDAHEQYDGLGETGEFVLAQREGDTIIFLLRRHKNQSLSKSHHQKTIKIGDEYALPMQRALLKKSGTIIAMDYTGVMVLAAYEPVNILNYGMVAKISLSEVRLPFLKAAFISLIIGLILIIIGVFSFRSITHPLIRRIHQAEARLRQILNSTTEGIYGIDIKE